MHSRARVRARGAVCCRASSSSGAAAAVAAPAAEEAQALEATAPLDLSLQPGVCAPCGEPGVSFWDPAGLAKGIDEATYRQYRTAELKHGRVSMLALAGLWAQHGMRLPGLEGSPSGFGAAEPGTPSSPFVGVILLFLGLIENTISDEGREPGDFGDPCDFKNSTGRKMAATQDDRDWQNFELNHGRVAMIGVIASFMAEYATGLDVVQQWEKFGPARRRTLDLLFSQASVLPLSDYIA